MSKIESIQVNAHGAELASIKADGKEFLWQANPQFWGRHAPILFPIVGKVAGGVLRIDGQEFSMGQHGFARDWDYEAEGPFAGACEVMLKDGQSVTFTSLKTGPVQNYPYRFKLQAAYNLKGDTVSIKWTVYNLDTRTMYFQFGAHPAFLLPDYNPSDALHGYLQCLDAAGKPVNPLLYSYLIEGLRLPFDSPMPQDGLIPLGPETFKADAFLLEKAQVKSAVLLDKYKKPVLEVSCPQADTYGLWAPHKPGCPFVCLEPWCGLADPAIFDGDISAREYIHSAPPGGSYSFEYAVRILA